MSHFSSVPADNDSTINVSPENGLVTNDNNDASDSDCANDVAFTDAATAAIAEYSGAFLAVFTGNTAWFDRYQHVQTEVRDVVKDIRDLDAYAVERAVFAGRMLNELRSVIQFSGYGWTKYCEKKFSQSPKTLSRFRVLAAAHIDREFYCLGRTKLYAVSEAVKSANKSCSSAVSVNCVLEGIDFDTISKDECGIVARNQVYKLVIKSTDHIAALKCDVLKVCLAIDADCSKKGLIPESIIESLKELEESERDAFLDKCIANGKVAKKQKKHFGNADVEESIYVLYARFMHQLEESEQKLSEKQLNDLQISLLNHIVM